MSWKLEIRKVNNGYILKGKFNDTDIVSEVLIENTNETEFNKEETMKKLLCEVKDYFGIYYSKHNKKNLKIEVKDEKENS